MYAITVPDYEAGRMDAVLLSRMNSRGMVRNFEAHPLRKVKTPAQEYAAFCASLDALNARRPAMGADDAAELARLKAVPLPSWARAMAVYRTHAQRMTEWYRELDKNAKPLIWRPIDASRAAMLANECASCDAFKRTGKPCDLKSHRTLKVWSAKRRDAVLRAAIARGDTLNTGPELMP